MNNQTRFVIMVDSISRRYNSLPSAFLRSGDVFDFYVADVGAKWEKHSEQCRKAGIDPWIGKNHGKSQEELLAMLKRAEEFEKSKK